MIVASARYELLVSSSSSLKDKRQVIRGLIERLRARFNVSVAEIGGQDSWQRAIIGVGCVSSKQHHARRMVDTVTRHVEGCNDVEITHVEVQLFAEDD